MRKMKKNKFWVSALALGLVATLTQCKNAEKVTPADENELITTVQLKFTESGTTAPLTFTFRDVDGDGGNPPSKFDSIVLKSNTTYTLAIELMDESKTPTVNTTEEVRKESDQHFFIYTTSPPSLLTYTYGDMDARNFPVGLTGTAKTGVAGTGKLKVQLRHQPPINGNPVKDGTAAPGSDDVNLDFNLKVK